MAVFRFLNEDRSSWVALPSLRERWPELQFEMKAGDLEMGGSRKEQGSEFFIRNVVAADICERVRYLHVLLEQAANDVVMKVLVEQHCDGGVIALDHMWRLVRGLN